MVINKSNLPLDPFIPFHFKCGGLVLANSQELTQLLTPCLHSPGIWGKISWDASEKTGGEMTGKSL